MAPAAAFGQTAVATMQASSASLLTTQPGQTVATVTVALRNGASAISPGGVNATFSWSNQQYPSGTSAVTPNASAFFGVLSTDPARNLWTPLNSVGGAGNSALFTSPHDATAGTGVNVATNYGLTLTVDTTPFRGLVVPARGATDRFQMADLTIAFDRPVAYPILHIHGMGGRGENVQTATGVFLNYKSIAMEFDFIPNSEASTIMRLSGNTTAFQVLNNLQIRNNATVTSFNPPFGMSAACAGDVRGYGACGSVRVNGTAVTSITLRVYVRSSDSWA